LADIPGDALATEGKEALKRERLTEIEAGKWLERGQAVWKRREISVLVIPPWANLL